MSRIVGIDLGTTNSVCAVIDPQGPQVILNAEGARITPSVVVINEDGGRFVGDVAKRQMLIHPESTIHSIKRFIGKKFEDLGRELDVVNFKVAGTENGDCAVVVHGRQYSPQELSALILRKMRESAQDFLGEEVTEAIITVPAYFTDPQRQATRDAATIAGFDVLRILNEPTAAALAYAHQRQTNATVAIYDFGGGTFDISLVSVSDDVAQVLATRGNNTLGGNDLDQRIVEWLLEELKKAEGIDASEDNVVLQRLKDAAERAKIDLSAADSAAIYLPFLIADESGPKHLQTNLTRATLEEIGADLFKETIDECQRALDDAALDASAIDEVIMVGGSSRIPRVQQLVSELFGKPLNKSVNPEEVVAIGAAVHASMLQGDTTAVTLLDVTNFSLGIEVEGRRFAPLIPKNTAIPAHATRMVSTVTENQKTVRIHILQGESSNSDDNVSLGEFELSGIPDAARGVPRIEVRFGIDTNGIVQVTATEKSTGTEHEIVIDNPIGLGQSKIDAMKERVGGGKLDGSATPSA